MPQGFQTFNAAGQPLMEITDRLARVLGIATLTSPTDGSISVAGFATGTPFAACIPISSGPVPVPTISIAAGVISWDFAAGVGYATNYKLVYGVY